MDDGLGFIVCAQGGVQDMTGVINDHAWCLVPGVTKELRHNLHVLHPFAIIRCNWDSWRGVFFFCCGSMGGMKLQLLIGQATEGRHVQATATPLRECPSITVLA